MNRYQDKTRELTASITHVVFDPTGKPPYSLDEFELMIATALLEAENQGIEKASETSDKWAHSSDCDSHSNNPCCHVRTGAAISEAIRALKGAE